MKTFTFQNSIRVLASLKNNSQQYHSAAGPVSPYRKHFTPLTFFRQLLHILRPLVRNFFFNMVTGHAEAFNSTVSKKMQKMTRNSEKMEVIQWT